VLDNPFYAITDDHGRFRTRRAAGEISGVAWLASGDIGDTGTRST